MASKHLAVLLLVVISAAIAGAAVDKIVPINISDPIYQTVGRLAVEDNNKKGYGHLYFIKVTGGSEVSQPSVQGASYYLDLTAVNCTQSSAVGNYLAGVYAPDLNMPSTYYYYGVRPRY